MLQNAYFLAKIGADTAENEQHFAEILTKTGRVRRAPSLADPYEGARRGQAEREAQAREQHQGDNARTRGSAKLAKLYKFFANVWRARSRLYQNEILQENMRLTAFFKLYKICILLHRCIFFRKKSV